MRRPFLHLLFLLGILAKGLDGLVESAGGLLLLIISHPALYALVLRITAEEISEDPRDLIAGYLIRFAGHLSLSTQLFIALYLVVHGLLKIFLVAAMLQKALWAYPAAVVVIAAFLAYQAQRLSHHFSATLLAFTLLDAAIAILIWCEYRRIKHSRVPPALSPPNSTN